MCRVLSFLTLFLITACSPPEVFSENESDQDEWSEEILSPTEGKKVLLIFIDGLIPSAIELSETPNIDVLMVDSAWSMTGRAESTTISGSGWSSFLTGVHWDKHQVPDNDFTNPNFTDYPHIFSQLKAGFPNSVVAGCQTWQPIESG
ncbi:MAG: alkaline phosphatase family protein, partial [Woeseiaceae bacterium]|nr:alkaline phosphatase family protein [Woeseiaceae bacterium]